MKIFLEYLVQKMDAHKASIKYTVLLDALPPARNEKELKHLQKLVLLSHPRIYKSTLSN